MVNTTSPYGTVSYQADPTAPGGFSQSTTLSPSQQALYDSGNQASQGALDVANQQIGRVGDALSQGLHPSDYGSLAYGANGGPIQTSFNQGQQVQGQVTNQPTQQAINQNVNAAYNQLTALTQPQQQLQQEQLNQHLADQGLSSNSAAYQNAQGIMGRNNAFANNQAANAAVLSGQNEQNTLYGQQLQSGQFANQAAGQEYNQGLGAATFANTAQQQGYGQQYQNATLNNTAQQQAFQQAAYAQSLPIQEFSQLLGSGQVQAPTGVAYTPTSVSPTDVTGAYALNAQQQQAQYQSQMQAQGGLLGGLFSLGSAALMPGVGGASTIGKLLSSDRRLKRDIEVIDVRHDGLYIYAYRYVWSAVRHIGVMAQEVLRVKPEAVQIMPDGFYAVDYELL